MWKVFALDLNLNPWNLHAINDEHKTYRSWNQVGVLPHFNFPIKNHVDLGESLDLMEFDTASIVSGSKFYYLRNAAALLEMALINYAFQKVASSGFTPIMTPDLVRESVLEKCGFRPRADNTQVGTQEFVLL